MADEEVGAEVDVDVSPQSPKGPQGQEDAYGESEEGNRNATSNVGQDLKHT